MRTKAEHMATLIFGFLHRILRWGAIKNPKSVLRHLPTLKTDVMFVVQLCPEEYGQDALRLFQFLYQLGLKHEDNHTAHIDDCVRLRHPFKQPRSAQVLADEFSQRDATTMVRRLVRGERLVWGESNVISLERLGRTGADGPALGLAYWMQSGKGHVILSKDETGTQGIQELHFNAAATGFVCAISGMRGYVLDRGFQSADAAGAPTAVVSCAICGERAADSEYWECAYCKLYLCDGCHSRLPGFKAQVHRLVSKDLTSTIQTESKEISAPLSSLAADVAVGTQFLDEADTRRIAELQQLDRENLSQQLCAVEAQRREFARQYREAQDKVGRLQCKIKEEEQRYAQLQADYDGQIQATAASAVGPKAAATKPDHSSAATAESATSVRRDRPEDDPLLQSSAHPKDITTDQCHGFVNKIRGDWESLVERRAGWHGTLRHLGADLYSNPLHFVNEILQVSGSNAPASRHSHSSLGPSILPPVPAHPTHTAHKFFYFGDLPPRVANPPPIEYRRQHI